MHQPTKNSDDQETLDPKLPSGNRETDNDDDDDLDEEARVPQRHTRDDNDDEDELDDDDIEEINLDDLQRALFLSRDGGTGFHVSGFCFALRLPCGYARANSLAPPPWCRSQPKAAGGGGSATTTPSPIPTPPPKGAAL